MTEPEAPKPPEKSPEPYIPSRLREKMQEDDEFKIPERSPVGIIVGILVVVVLAAVGFWIFHSQQVKAKQVAQAKAQREQQVADSLAAIHRADSLLAVHRADSVAAFQKLPKSKQHEILVAQAKAKGGTALVDLEKSEGPYAIDAGEFLFPDKAQSKADALKGSTQLPVTVKKAGGSYHIYVGKFETKAAANKAVGGLVAKGLIEEATVVPVR